MKQAHRIFALDATQRTVRILKSIASNLLVDAAQTRFILPLYSEAMAKIILNEYLLLLLFILTAGGCTSLPAPIENITEVKPDTTIVYGSADVYLNNEQQKLGFTWSGQNDLYFLILPADSSNALTFKLSKDGEFYWSLEPGEYMLLAYKWYSAGSTRSGDLRANLSITGSGPDLYLGAIEIHLGRAMARTLVLDKFDDAQSVFDQRFPQRQGTSIKNLLEFGDPPGNYAKLVSACDASLGVECNENHYGVTPLSPESPTSGMTSGFSTSESITPLFSWQGSSKKGISYDLAIYEAALYSIQGITEEPTRGRLVNYVENIEQAQWKVDKPLKSGTMYYWSVRMRDQDTVSAWSTQSYHQFMLFAGRSGWGQWFKFQTPE